MKAYLREYRVLTKAGLLRNSHKMILGTSIFMFFFGNILGIELEILIFILTAIGYMLDFDANKYVVNYSMPICLKRRLRMLYDTTIVSSFLSVMMASLRYHLMGVNRSITLCLFIFLVNIIGCNLYYYLFCSQEFKKDVLDEDKRQLIYQGAIGGLIGFSVSTRLQGTLNSRLEAFIIELNRLESVILIGCLLGFTIWWTKKSRRMVEKIVRSGRKNYRETYINQTEGEDIGYEKC